MIDLIHLQRLRQQRLRYEAAQRLLLLEQPVAVVSKPRSEARRALLRIVSAVVLGAAVDGTATRSLMRRARR
jgi:hypothetical protein